MNLKQQLTKIFEKKRIVVWYDAYGGFGNTATEWLPDDVKLITVDNNEFGIKTKIFGEKNQKFLIYSNKPKPDPEENWLLDVAMTGHEFSAEKVALLLQEMEFPTGFRGFVEDRLPFFNSEGRKKKLAQLIGKEDRLTESHLALMMIAVTLGEQPVMDDILLALINDARLQGDKFPQIQKFKLDGFIKDYLTSRFGFQGKLIIVDELPQFLFKSEFERHIPVESSKSWNQKEEWTPAAESFFKNWMNNSRYKESFDHFARLFEEGSKAQEKLSLHGYEKFIDCKAPECVDKEIVKGLARGVENKTVTSSRIKEIIGIRLYCFYFEGYKHLYDALYHAALLTESVKLFPPKFTTADEGFKYYSVSGAAIDTCYRKYYFSVKGRKHESVLGAVTKIVEQTWLNNFLFPLEVAWKKALELQGKWSFSSIIMQNRFYQTYIQPFNGSDKRIFVVISDALRYEAAAELTERLVKNDKFEAKLEMIAGAVPSYTQLGMAALLPNKDLQIIPGGDSVAIDGKPASAGYREARLIERNPRSRVFSASEFVKMDSTEGREAVKALEVIYIYHNKIDSTGDDKTSEGDTFKAVEDAFEDIENLLRRIAAFNGYNVLITADHGFHFQESKLPDNEFIDASIYGNVEVLKRRVAFGSNFNTDEKVIKMTAEQVGITSTHEFLFPAGRANFKLAGAGSRFVHGGLSLQEVAIPVIKFTKKRTADTELVGIAIISKGSNNLTTNNPVFELIQNKPVSQKVLEREVVVGIYAPDGTLLSDEQTLLFNLQGSDARQLLRVVRFVMRGDISRYNNKRVALMVKDKMVKPSEDPLITRMDLFLNIPLANDFDDF